MAEVHWTLHHPRTLGGYWRTHAPPPARHSHPLPFKTTPAHNYPCSKPRPFTAPPPPKPRRARPPQRRRARGQHRLGHAPELCGEDEPPSGKLSTLLLLLRFTPCRRLVKSMGGGSWPGEALSMCRAVACSMLPLNMPAGGAGGGLGVDVEVHDWGHSGVAACPP